MRLFKDPMAVGGLAILLVLIAALGLLKACAAIGSPAGYRYKTTIYVETANGTRTYSGIREVRFSSDFSLEGFDRHHLAGVRGEAIALTDRNGRTVFALQDKVDEAEAILALLPIAKQMPGGASAVRANMLKLSEEYPLPQHLTRGEASGTNYHPDEAIATWPVFVTFTTLSNPETMQIVDPAKIGVSKITIQITDDKLEPKIERMFEPEFWSRWQALSRRTLPEREADPHGRSAPFYRYNPGHMKLL